METSLFLAQVIGLYLIIQSIVLMVRLKEIQKVVQEFINDRALIFFMSMMATMVGLLLVVSHNVWEANWRVIVTVFGWAILIKGILYMSFSHKKMELLVRKFNTRNWYIGGGIVSLIAGLYLVFKGFGL